MTTKAAARPAVPAGLVPHSASWLTPPLTTDDRLLRIRALGQRIDGHVQFMCAVAGLGGTSQEAKERAVAVFYECLQTLEEKLDRIQGNLRLE